MILFHLVLAALLAWGALEVLHRILPKPKARGFLSEPKVREALLARGWAKCPRCAGPFVLGRRCLWCEEERP